MFDQSLPFARGHSLNAVLDLFLYDGPFVKPHGFSLSFVGKKKKIKAPNIVRLLENVGVVFIDINFRLSYLL